MFQFMIIENMGKKVLLLRGYTGMSATLILLTVTLCLQVSHHETKHCERHISAYLKIETS